MSDLDTIIEGCRKGNAVMQKALYDRYCGKYYLLCRRYSHNDSVAQEVLSDGFMKVFESISSYRNEGPFEGWMRTIFVRCAIRRYNNERQPMETLDENELPAELSLGKDEVSILDMRQSIMAAMRQLTDLERQAFNMIAVEGYKLEEVSQMLGVNLSTVKTRYYNSLRRMRKMLEGVENDE